MICLKLHPMELIVGGVLDVNFEFFEKKKKGSYLQAHKKFSQINLN